MVLLVLQVAHPTRRRFSANRAFLTSFLVVGITFEGPHKGYTTQAFHGSGRLSRAGLGQLSRVRSGRVGSGRIRVTQLHPWHLKTSSPDPGNVERLLTRRYSTRPDFENLLPRPAGRVMTRETPGITVLG